MTVDSSIEVHAVGPRRPRFLATCGKGQGGFVLLMVLTVIAILSIVAVALLQLTTTTNNAAVGLPKAMSLMREADSALDATVGQIRSNPNLCATYTSTSPTAPIKAMDGTTFPHVKKVTCTSNPVTYPANENATNAPRRDLTISVFNSTTAAIPFGQVRVFVVDFAKDPFVGKTVATGYLLNVCDWQVGAAVSSTVNPCEPVA